MKTIVILIIVSWLFSCKKKEVNETWTSWVVKEEPVFKGQFSLVGDPSIIKENGKYRMYYTGFDAFRTPQGREICQASSSDGLTWTNVPVNNPVEGRMLFTTSNNWSNAHETSFLLKFNNSYFLYFIGYQDKGGFFNSSPVSLGLVTSSDGENFIAPQPIPVMIGTPNGYDRDAISSPSISTYRDFLIMIYSGYCYTNCGTAATSNLLAATSADGIKWIKKNVPIISGAEIPWASKGVAESELVLGPDNLYYLFMTSIDDPHVIGVPGANLHLGPGM